MQVKQILSNAKSLAILFKESICDLILFYRAALLNNSSDDTHLARLEGAIIRHYHVIEKSLSMPDFQFGLGKRMVENLILLLNQYESLHPDQKKQIDFKQIEAAASALHEYRNKHQSNGYNVAELFSNFSKQHYGNLAFGGSKEISAECLLAAPSGNYTDFLRSRVSVRAFDVNWKPSEELLWEIADLANTAPSVCNRQTSRLHFFLGDRAQEVLSFQKGNRGFGHTIPAIAIVTSDQRYFVGAAERNQGWIDGGMFAMQTLLAIHAMGLGAVPLNWSVLNKQDRSLRNAVNIPQHERIIVLIGFGNRTKSRTPFSMRKDGKSIARIHQ